LPISCYYKSKLLDLLRVLVVFNNKPIKNNQIHLMSLMQSKQFKNTIIFLPSSEQQGDWLSSEDFTELIKEYEHRYDQSFETGFLSISPQLTYYLTFF
jgi:inositol 1,4,5-triphosphate receptor type 1/inositol 1,4,5-triphosphate receptor type 3